MSITINEEFHSVPDGANLEKILHVTGYDRPGIAVARNGRIVPRDTWTTEQPEDGDQLLVIAAAQGG